MTVNDMMFHESCMTEGQTCQELSQSMFYVCQFYAKTEEGGKMDGNDRAKMDGCQCHEEGMGNETTCPQV